MSHAPSTAQKAGAKVLAAFLAVAPVADDPQAQPPALRNTSSTTTTQTKRPVEIMDEATDFAMQNNGIGVYINIGPQATVNEDELGRALVNRLKKRGVANVDYFVTHAKRGTVEVSYFVNVVSGGVVMQGPYPPSKVWSGLDAAAADFIQDQAKIRQ